MIWPIVPILQRYALPIGIVLVLALGWAWHRSAVNTARRQGYEQAQGEYAVLLAKANAAVAARDAQARKRIHEVENAHQKALSDLDARYADATVPVVRLCREPARRRELPAVSGSPALDTGPASADGLPRGAAADIGPRLERLVRAADEQTQRLMACQSYVNSLRQGILDPIQNRLVPALVDLAHAEQQFRSGRA